MGIKESVELVVNGQIKHGIFISEEIPLKEDGCIVFKILVPSMTKVTVKKHSS